MTTGARVGNLKAWAALVVATASAAIVVAVIGVSLHVGTAVAATGTGPTIKATTFEVAARDNGEAFAVCPREKRALGGGVVQSGSPAGIFVRASGPLDSTGTTLKTIDGDIPKMWYAAVQNINPTARTFKVFAICAGASDATIESTSFIVGRHESDEAFAVCPPGKRALGGGVVQSGFANNQFVLASGPLDNTGVTTNTITGDVAKQWYAAVSNNARSKTFRVFAICSGTSDATIVATPFGVEPLKRGQEFAECRIGERALGGGVVQSGSASRLNVQASGPLDETGVTLNTMTGDIPKQWYAAVFNESGLREFKVFAICE